MIRTNKPVLLAVISVLLAFSSVKADQFSTFPVGTFRSGKISGLINNNNFSVKNQFIFSFSSFGGSSFLRNAALSSFSYKPSPFWTLSLGLGAEKFSGLSGPALKTLTTPVVPLYSLSAEYRKTKDSRFIANFGNIREYRGAGWPGAFIPRRNFSDSSALSGADILKNNDWSLSYEQSFFDDMLNVSVTYGHTSPPR